MMPARSSPAAIAPPAPSQRTAESPSTFSASTVARSPGTGPRHDQAQPPASTASSSAIGAGAADASSSAVLSDASVDRVPMTTPPVLQTPASLVYPAEAFRIELNRTALTPALTMQAIDGRVVLKVLVQGDGTVRRVEIAHSSGSAILDEAAAREAAAWRFRPATRDGLPIDAWALIPVNISFSRILNLSSTVLVESVPNARIFLMVCRACTFSACEPGAVSMSRLAAFRRSDNSSAVRGGSLKASRMSDTASLTGFGTSSGAVSIVEISP